MYWEFGKLHENKSSDGVSGHIYRYNLILLSNKNFLRDCAFDTISLLNAPLDLRRIDCEDVKAYKSICYTTGTGRNTHKLSLIEVTEH